MCEISEKSEISPGSERGLQSAIPRRENMRNMSDKRDKGVPYAQNPLLPMTNGTICLSVRYLSAMVPFVIGHRWSSHLGWPELPGELMFPKLSKLLNQEDALGTPWLRGNCYPQARPRGALRTGVTRHFDVTLSLAHPVIMLASADVSAVVSGGCTGSECRCKAKQNRHSKTALTSGS